MKKIFKLLLTLAIALSIVPLTNFNVFADVKLPEEATWLVNKGDNHVWYKYTDTNKDGTKETLVVGGSGEMIDLSIDPQATNKQPWLNSVTSLTIQQGITVIGENAFRNTSISTVTIPNTVKTIKAYAFANCALTKVTFENNSTIESIGESAFANNKLVRFDFPASLKAIYGSKVLYNNPLTLVKFLGKVSQLDLSAFYATGLDVSTLIDQQAYDLLTSPQKELYYPTVDGSTTSYGKKLAYECEILFPTSWTLSKIDSKGMFFNGYFCKHIHSKHVVLKKGVSPRELVPGYKDYYQCEECGKHYEDAECTAFIADIDSWKAINGRGYIPSTRQHSLMLMAGRQATYKSSGYYRYYKCTDCGRCYEDIHATVLIPDINAWKSKGGRGYIEIIDHDHEPLPVVGEEPTDLTAGYKTYYHCFCGEDFEDKECTIAILDIESWKAEGGNGYLAPTTHVCSADKHYGMSATESYDGYKDYFVCKCGKCYEDENCTIEIKDLATWMNEGGQGFMPKISLKPDYTITIIIIVACALTIGFIVLYKKTQNKEKEIEEVKEEPKKKTTKKTTKKTEK